MFIKDLGWDLYFEALWTECRSEDCVPARVVSQQRGLWRVAGDFGECWAEASGRLERNPRRAEIGRLSAIGYRQKFARETNAQIQHVLPRRSRFAQSCQQTDHRTIIVANIDVALIVAALDGDFNVRRIERYMAQCWESGARPAIVLNKADACAERHERAAEIEEIARSVPVFLISAKTGEGLDALETYFLKGQTIVLLGSSGAGKSTLVNRLLQEERQPTYGEGKRQPRAPHNYIRNCSCCRAAQWSSTRQACAN